MLTSWIPEQIAVSFPNGSEGDPPSATSLRPKFLLRKKGVKGQKVKRTRSKSKDKRSVKSVHYNFSFSFFMD
jgi:hypothetical protein